MASLRGRPARATATTIVLAGALLASAAPAHAWTEAQVQSARAHVDLRPDGRALVALTLDVRVQRGWLKGLELAGLDPDLELIDDKPPWVTSEDGRKYTPQARLQSDGRVVLSFAKGRRPPRRGSYRVGLVYATRLAPRATERRPDGHLRVHWTLPGWRSGLDGVRIAVTAPPQAHAAPLNDGDGDDGAQHSRTSVGSRTLLRWRRAHLPRTVPWTVALDVPAEQMAVASQPTGAPHRADHPTAARAGTGDDGGGGDDTGHGRWPPAAVVLAALVGLLALGKRLGVRHACHRAGVRPRPLIPLPHDGLRATLVVAAAMVAAWSWAGAPAWAITALAATVALVLEQPPRTASAPRPGAWTAAGRQALGDARRQARRDRLLGTGAVDASAPVGILVLAAAVLTLWQVRALHPPPDAMLDPMHGLWALAALALTGTRFHVPAPPHARLAQLLRLAGRWRVPLDGAATGVALRPIVHVDPRGRWQDARLRLEGTRAPDGLLQLDVAIADARGAGVAIPTVVLVVVCRAGSPADRAAQRTWPSATIHRGPGGRTARLVTGPRPLTEALALLGSREPAPRERATPSAAPHAIRDAA